MRAWMKKVRDRMFGEEYAGVSLDVTPAMGMPAVGVLNRDLGDNYEEWLLKRFDTAMENITRRYDRAIGEIHRAFDEWLPAPMELA